MDISIFEKIGKLSNKIFFIFSLESSQFEYLNDSVEHVWAGTLDKYLQQPVSLLEEVHPDDRELIVQQFEKLLLGIPCSNNFRLYSPNSEARVVQVDAYPILDENDQVVSVAGIAEDISREEQYVGYLMEFGRKKNSALEIVAHDLRGPLAMVQSMADSLEKDHLDHVYDELPNYAQFIKKACVSCLELISNVLHEEHLRSPAIYVNLERVEIVARVKEVVNTYASNKRIKQNFVINGPPMAFIQADAVKFDQIMNNLVSNSIKFSKPDGQIIITIKDEPEQLLLIHQDNGVGIPAEDQPYVFDRYTKASRAGLSGEKSVGIGMSIVKNLVELQHGKIWFESEENKGTTFYISFPKRLNPQ